MSNFIVYKDRSIINLDLIVAIRRDCSGATTESYYIKFIPDHTDAFFWRFQIEKERDNVYDWITNYAVQPIILKKEVKNQ